MQKAENKVKAVHDVDIRTCDILLASIMHRSPVAASQIVENVPRTHKLANAVRHFGKHLLQVRQNYGNHE